MIQPDDTRPSKPRNFENYASHTTGGGFSTVITILGIVLALAAGLGRAGRRVARNAAHAGHGVARGHADIVHAPGGSNGLNESRVPSEPIADGEKSSGPLALDDEHAKAILEEGYEIGLTTSSNRDEYAGKPNEMLDMVRDAGETDTILRVAGDVVTRTVEQDVLPDPDKNEHARCQVQFDRDGRPFLVLSERRSIEGDSEPLVTGGRYELEVLEGTQEDFDAGKPVKLCYSAKGLKSLQHEFVRVLELIVTPMLLDASADTPNEEPPLRRRVSVAFDEFSNADIEATTSSCTVQDRQRTVIRVTVAPKTE